MFPSCRQLLRQLTRWYYCANFHMCWHRLEGENLYRGALLYELFQLAVFARGHIQNYALKSERGLGLC